MTDFCKTPMDRNGEERSVTRKEQPHDIIGTQKVRRISTRFLMRREVLGPLSPFEKI